MVESLPVNQIPNIHLAKSLPGMSYCKRVVKMTDVVMPAGIFKGKQMHQIPSGYLKWIAENWKEENICIAADEEFQYREKYGGHFWD